MGEEPGKGHVLRIEDDLTAVNAASLREQFAGVLAEEGPLLLDLSKVNEMDTAGFQLLSALKHGADSAGREFRIIAQSSATHAILKLYNMEEYFGLDADVLGILGGNGEDEEPDSRADSAE